VRFPRTPRRLQFVFAAQPLYFVTFCSFRKRPYLATAAVHNAFEAFGERAYAEHNVAIGRYVIMPDHVHLFVCGDAGFDLTAWFRVLKPYLGKAVVRRATEDPIWQRGFFDHALRSDESYGQKWEYVRENPVRAGLVKAAKDWRYAGEIVSIEM
jgi:REP element-mobilizing transposase RayT